jgi:hypothetical protein
VSWSVSHKKSDDPFEVDHQNWDHINRINDFFFQLFQRRVQGNFLAGQSGPNVNKYCPALPDTDAN